MRKLLLLLSIFLSFTLVAASCGDDDSSDVSTDTGDGDDMAEDDGDDMAEDDGDDMAEDDGDDMAEDTVHVGLVFDIGGEGDQSFNDSAAAGLNRAEETFNITTTKVSPNDDGSNRAELLQLQADSSEIVLAIGFLFAGDAAAVGGGNGDTNFAVIDDSMLNFDEDPPVPLGDNLAGLVFSEEQGSFLVGAAAALSSETGTVGFIGGVCCFGLIEKFEAGFRAGVLHVNPEIEIISQYITEFPDFDGFNAPDRGRETALAIFEEGADVIYPRSGWHRCRVVHRSQGTQRSHRLKGLGYRCRLRSVLHRRRRCPRVRALLDAQACGCGGVRDHQSPPGGNFRSWRNPL